MNPHPVIGIDLGYSADKKSCAAALANCSLPLNRSERSYRPSAVRTALYRLPELEQRIRVWHTRPNAELARSVVVMDGPVGEKTPAMADRLIDDWCSSGAFRLRSQFYRVTQARDFVDAVERMLHALSRGGDRPSVWMGGPLPDGQLIIAETNPTPVLALLMPQGNVEHLVSRSKHRRLDGIGTISAKSDWYWHCGANRQIAAALGAPQTAGETHHDRIAALVCLAIGLQLAGHAGDGSGVVAIGDATGIYTVPARCHPDWQAWVDGHLHDGTPDWSGSFGPYAKDWDTPFRWEELALRRRQDVATKPDRLVPEEPPFQSPRTLSLVLTDIGLVHEGANRWLA